MARYTYEVDGRIVKCISSYAGKPVIGIAKCNPKDEFNEEVGKELAKLRCDLKVAEKRCKRANKEELIARKAMFAAEDYYADRLRYFGDSFAERDEVREKLMKLSNVLLKTE